MADGGAVLQVELVAADRRVWSGEARLVVARTLEGDLGIMPGHEPLLGVLANGVVTIRGSDGADVRAAVLGGFLSVADNLVSILAESVELSGEIDVAAAEAALREATEAGTGDEEAVAAKRRAEARLRAARPS